MRNLLITFVISAVLCSMAACNGGPRSASNAPDNVETSRASASDFSYIGPPGPIPNTKIMPANQYGAYTFASPMNFCRGARWIIRGTMASLWPDEPHPVLVKRGTAVRVLDQQQVDCGSLDDRLSYVQGDLVRYQPLAGGADRYVAASDIHSQQEYDAYKEREAAIRRATAPHHRTIAKAPAPLIAPEAIVLNYGYEGALDQQINHNVDATITHNAPCSIAAAQNYLGEGQAAFAAKNYTKARLLSWSSWEYSGSCNEKRGSQEQGDALLIFAKSEIRLGKLTAGKNDADAAASSYSECVSAEDVYDQATRDYCSERHAEATDIVQNG